MVTLTHVLEGNPLPPHMNNTSLLALESFYEQFYHVSVNSSIMFL